MQSEVNDDEFILSISSLLHDIGKVRQRYEKENTHQYYSEKIAGELAELRGQKSGKIQDIILNLIKHHHTKEDQLPEELRKDPQFLKHLDILKFSDWKSAGHDREDKDSTDTMNHYTVALEKIFCHLENWEGDLQYFPPYMLHDSDEIIKLYRERDSWDRGSTNFDFLKKIPPILFIYHIIK